jgi:hypothetical protein
LDRASDFESLPAVLQFLTKTRKQFNLGCLAGFRATPLKSFFPKKKAYFGTKLAQQNAFKPTLPGMPFLVP